MSAELHRGDLLTVNHPAHGRDAHTEHLSGIVEGHQRFTLERRIHATSVYESKALSSDVKSGFRAQDAAKRVPDAGPHIGRNWAFSSIFERLIWFFSRLTRGIAGWRPLSGFSTLPPCFFRSGAKPDELLTLAADLEARAAVLRGLAEARTEPLPT